MYRALSKMPKICKLEKWEAKRVKWINQRAFIWEVVFKKSIFSRKPNDTLDSRIDYLFNFKTGNKKIIKAFKDRFRLKQLLNWERKEKKGTHYGSIKQVTKEIDENPQANVESVLTKEMKADVFWWV
jgi:hypothetical protein